MSIACRDRDSPWSQAFPGRAGQSVTLRFAITGDSELAPTPTLVKRLLCRVNTPPFVPKEARRYHDGGRGNEFTLKAQQTLGQWSDQKI